MDDAAEVLFTTKGAAENKVVIKLYVGRLLSIVVKRKTIMFGGRLASFGEIAVAAGCLCGYPCWMSYLAI